MSEILDNAGSGAAAALNDPAVRIRLMQLADVRAVHELDILSFSLPWPERSYRFEISENKNAIPLVVETIAGEVIGMSVTWVIVDEAHIATIALRPDMRRRGLGKKLLAHSLRLARERGARTAYLEVRRGNLAAQAMYRAFGFVEVGVRPRYYQDNHEDALLLTLDRIDPRQFSAWLDPEQP